MKLKAMITMTPGAPNNKKQFHVEHVEIDDIKQLFQKEYGIAKGSGPVLEVYIPPGEATARFQWVDDAEAEATIELLLGLNSHDPNEAGLVDDPETKGVDESKMNGFILANSEQGQQSELTDHARSVAAEVLAAFADNRHGRVATSVPGRGLRLKGNMSGATIQVAAAPSGKVNTVHEFPGQSKPISRFALMSHDTRRIVLGIIPFGKGDG